MAANVLCWRVGARKMYFSRAIIGSQSSIVSHQMNFLQLCLLVPVMRTVQVISTVKGSWFTKHVDSIDGSKRAMLMSWHPKNVLFACYNWWSTFYRFTSNELFATLLACPSHENSPSHFYRQRALTHKTCWQYRWQRTCYVDELALEKCTFRVL